VVGRVIAEDEVVELTCRAGNALMNEHATPERTAPVRGLAAVDGQ
jgi:hypothetical protein